MVWSMLPAAVPTAQILELYRLRWQIELIFKRMKSIELPQLFHHFVQRGFGGAGFGLREGADWVVYHVQ